MFRNPPAIQEHWAIHTHSVEDLGLSVFVLHESLEEEVA